MDASVNAQANVRAFLHLVMACEGVDKAPDPYRVLFGWPAPGRTFESFADHPRKLYPFTQTDGTTNWSSSAGAYQIIRVTFDRLRVKLKLSGFDPAVQDAMAMELIAEDGAMADVKAGRIQQAMDRCAGTWASLPASHYAQPKRTVAFALAAYQKAGGTLADEGVKV